MSHEQTKAFVLKRLPYGEGDLVVHLLTEHGRKMTGFVSRARASKKRFAGQYDLFNLLDLRYRESRTSNMVSIVGSDLIEGREPLRHDLISFGATCFFAEVILEFTSDHVDHPPLFLLFADAMKALQKTNLGGHSLIPLVEHRLLEYFGFRPVMHHCLGCEEKILGANSYWFSSHQGGIYCQSCTVADSGRENSSNSHVMSGQTLSHLLAAQALSPDQWARLVWPENHVSEARRVLEFFIQFTAGKPFKSLQFLNQVLPHSVMDREQSRRIA